MYHAHVPVYLRGMGSDEKCESICTWKRARSSFQFFQRLAFDSNPNKPQVQSRFHESWYSTVIPTVAKMVQNTASSLCHLRILQKIVRSLQPAVLRSNGPWEFLHIRIESLYFCEISMIEMSIVTSKFGAREALWKRFYSKKTSSSFLQVSYRLSYRFYLSTVISSVFWLTPVVHFSKGYLCWPLHASSCVRLNSEHVVASSPCVHGNWHVLISNSFSE